MSTFRPLVVYPDAVTVALNFLRPALAARTEPEAAGVTLHARVPTPRTLPFVLVRAAGGVISTATIDRPRVDVQVWHRDEFNAAALAQLTRGLLHTMTGRGPVRGVRDFLGPTPVPDPESGNARYLLTVEMTLRGALRNP